SNELEKLWAKHIVALTDDILYSTHQHSHNPELQLTEPEIENDALNQLETILFMVE
ncbi:1904_t:CDS:1, partial [Racocetra persica]